MASSENCPQSVVMKSLLVKCFERLDDVNETTRVSVRHWLREDQVIVLHFGPQQLSSE